MNKTPILAAALLLSTAAEAKPLGDKITATVLGVEDVRIGLGGAGFTVVTELTRKKFPPTVLTGLSFDVMLNGQKIGEGAIEESARLRRNKAVRVEIPTRISAVAGMSALTGGADLTISGAVKGRWLFFSQERTFERTLSLDDLMSGAQKP